jgi:hypothetical protein
LYYYDLHLNPGRYCYDVDAKYNLTSYGLPGMFGYSRVAPNGPACVDVAYGYPLPFFEPWDMATFSFQKWTFMTGNVTTPTSTNWLMNTAFGNPTPCADFSWQPIQSPTYNLSLSSPTINASAWTCADIWADFDLKLADRYATGDEILDFDIYVNGNWINKASFKNEGSFDWTLKHIDISTVKGKAFKVRFRANGVNSADILHWYVDNIHIYGVCHAPTTLAGQQNQFTTTLTWVAPVCGGGGPPPQWIFWDQQTNYTSIGYNAAYDFQIAARWNPVQLAPLDGGAVTKVKFWPASAGAATWRVRIWEGAAGTSMVVDQAVTAPIVNDQFNEVTLTTPHPIDVSQDMYVGMDVNASGGWPAGCDAGPAIVGFGDMFNDGTGWVAMSQPPNSLNYNWNLAAYIEPAKKGALASPVILTQTPVNNPKGLNMSTSGIVNTNTTTNVNTSGSGKITPNSPMGSQLLGYNVYRTPDNATSPFAMINPAIVTGLTYQDVHPSTTEPTTTWMYYVTAVFQDSLAPGPILCEPPSDTITITFPAVGINDLTNGTLNLYPNPATEVVNVVSSNNIKTIEVLNYVGQTIYSNRNLDQTTVQLNVTNFRAGVYFVKVTTTIGIKTTKITVTH